MVQFCDLPGTPYGPVSKILSVKIENSMIVIFNIYTFHEQKMHVYNLEQVHFSMSEVRRYQKVKKLNEIIQPS